jgi:hypothetical protein
MRTHQTILALLAAMLLASGQSNAATFVAGDANAGGIGYFGYLTVGALDQGSLSTHTGAWSWSDQSLAVDGSLGWTHTSRWLALEVLSDSIVNFTMLRDASVPYTGSGNVGGFAAVDHMFPSYTLWSGWDNDDGDHHTYNNTGNVSWAEDLTYLRHIGNNTQESITDSFFLAAGRYSVVLGSNSSSVTNPPRQGFSAFFATPEPGRASLAFMSAIFMVMRRRRHSRNPRL